MEGRYSVCYQASQSLNIIQRLGLTTRDGITDVLDINNEPGIYNVDLTKLNLPVSTYGIVAIVKNASGNWIYAIFIPTDMTAMYFAFYNGYSTPAGWTAWKRVSFSAIT